MEEAAKRRLFTIDVIQTVMTYRADNDELLPDLTRPMTPDERQMSLEDLINLPPGEDPRIAEVRSSEENTSEETEDSDGLVY